MRNIIVGLVLGLVGLFVFSCNQAKSPDDIDLTITGDTALDGLTAAISNRPDDPTLYEQRALIYYEKQLYDNAISDLQQALKIDSNNTGYLNLLAEIQLDYYQSFEALKTLEKSLKVDPNNIVTLLKMSNFQYLLKKYDTAINTAKTVLQKDPQNANAYFIMGLSYREMEETEKAMNVLQKTVELDPHIIDAWQILGQLHADAGSPLARRYFDSAEEIEPNNVNILLAKADYLADQEELDASIQLYRKIIRLNPQFERAHFNVGLLYLDVDSLQKAHDHFNLTINISPTHAKAYYFRGITLALLGQENAARQNFEQALRFDPDLEQAKQALSDINVDL